MFVLNMCSQLVRNQRPIPDPLFAGLELLTSGRLWSQWATLTPKEPGSGGSLVWYLIGTAHAAAAGEGEEDT